LAKNVKIKVVIIGSGNLAWHLVSHLSFFRRFELLVYNRKTTQQLSQLKKEFKVQITDEWKEVPKNADFYFICTGDGAIRSVAAKLKKLKVKGFVIHTSGTAPLSVLNNISKNTGVFYPLQTFSFGKSVNWYDVPVFIESKKNKDALLILKRLAGLFSHTVTELNSKERIKLHLAAVLAGNFANAMYASAWIYLGKELDKSYFKYLLPLINQTAKKVKTVNPPKAQTGPAARDDKSTQKKHLQLLNAHPDLKKTYKAISKLIIRQQKSNAKF